MRLTIPLQPARGEATIPFGKYELLERINIGGMAEILKARDTSREDQGLIAVKRILPHLIDDRQFVTMFLDESRVLEKLQHENIIRTLEIGQVEETPYIALEYVWGQDARMLFHRARKNGQATPIPLACYVIAQVCAALHYAHELTDEYGQLLGVVHRDVSLQNVLISYDGAVKLTDFGIALSAQNRARTEAGVVKGKFGYMSPEQIRGEPMDRRSDVFATGICLYELLTNERLFSGESDYAAVEKVRNVAVEPPSRWNREIPQELEAIVMRALARRPRDRHQTAAELRRDLLAFMAEHRYECSASDLAVHMRVAFADELRLAPTPDVLRRDLPRREREPTGLAAFDDLEPVSAMSSASAVHLTRAEPQPPEAMDGFEPEEDFPGDDDVTRQIHVSQTFSGVSVPLGSGVRRHVPAAPNPLPPFATPTPLEPVPEPAAPREPTQRTVTAAPARYPTAQTSYGIVISVVVAIVAVIAFGLWVTRGSRPSAVHLSTSPPDAQVRVDGALHPQSRSPFIIERLEPEVPHVIEVFKEGHRGWTTRLSLSPGQVLRLPPVHLEPVRPPALEPEGAPPPDEGAAAHTSVHEREAAEARPSRPRARTQRPAPRTEPRAKSRPRAGAETETSAGALRLNSRPWSEVTIDGRRVGTTPIIDHPLPAGRHTVRLENREFGLRKSIEIRIEPGQTVTRVIDLQ